MLYKSALMTMASGSVEGLTASHNRSGSYFRAKVIPVNPSTVRQNTMRTILANLAQLWQDLTAIQRSLWGEFADATPSVNRLGQDLILTGQNAYIKANAPIELIGGVIVSDPPAEYNNGQAVTPDPDTWEFNIDDDTWSIDVNRAGAESVDGQVLTFRGRAQNPSRGFYKGPYQLADVQPIPLAGIFATCQATIGIDDLSDYAIPQTGALIPLAFTVSYEDGRYSHRESTLIAPDLTTTGV